MARKQILIPGGLRKSVNIPDAATVGTTLAGYAGQTLTIAQLQTLLGVTAPLPNTQIPTGGSTTIINNTARKQAQAAGMFIGGGGGNGKSGPPGKKGAAGAKGDTGATGPAGTPGGPRGFPIALVSAPAPPRTPMLVRGPRGLQGPTGPAGAGGSKLKLWMPRNEYHKSMFVGRAKAASAANITPDTHPASPTPFDDEFESGTTINSALWTWRQQNTATAVVGKGSVLVTAQVTASNIINAFDQALPAGPCSFVCKAGGYMPSNQNVITPIFLYEPSSGKAFGLGLVFLSGSMLLVSVATTALASSWLTNPIANAAAPVPFSNANVVPSPQIYWRVDIASTTFTVSLSWDGLIWHPYGTFTTTTLFTTAPTRIGVSVTANDSAAATAQLSMDWFRRTA